MSSSPASAQKLANFLNQLPTREQLVYMHMDEAAYRVDPDKWLRGKTERFITELEQMKLTRDDLAHIVDKEKGCNVLHRVIELGLTPLALKMIDMRADLQRIDKEGNNAMHLACMFADPLLVRVLEEHHVHPDKENKHGETALHLLMRHAKPENIERVKECARDLTGHNAATNILSVSRKTCTQELEENPHLSAAQKKDLLQSLIRPPQVGATLAAAMRAYQANLDGTQERYYPGGSRGPGGFGGGGKGSGI